MPQHLRTISQNPCLGHKLTVLKHKGLVHAGDGAAPPSVILALLHLAVLHPPPPPNNSLNEVAKILAICWSSSPKPLQGILEILVAGMKKHLQREQHTVHP